ncbi:MAG: large ribosomal subunit protein bL35 [Planctomycetota bacterium]|jgi:large subunit ribosomal protein L35
MPKNKSHNGLLKRVRVTKTGKIKLRRAYGRHLRSHKPGSVIRKYRRPKYAQGPDAKRLRRLLGLKVGPTSVARPALERTGAGTPAEPEA